MTRIIALLAPLVTGAIAGSIIGGIVTGSDAYAIVWALGIPISIVLIVAVAASKKSAVKAAESPPDAPAPGPRGPVRLRRGIAVFLVLAGMAVALIPAYPMLGWIAGDIAQGRPFDGRDMRTGLHQNDAIAQIAEVVGSPDVTRINFYEDYIIVTARTSPRSTTVDSYMWRYGGAFRSGPGGFEPELAEQLFDASKLDFSIIPSLISIAKRDAGMNDAEYYYPSVSRVSEPDGLGDPVISISLSNEYFDAYYSFSFDGEILSKSGSAFE